MTEIQYRFDSETYAIFRAIQERPLNSKHVRHCIHPRSNFFHSGRPSTRTCAVLLRLRRRCCWNCSSRLGVVLWSHVYFSSPLSPSLSPSNRRSHSSNSFAPNSLFSRLPMCFHGGLAPRPICLRLIQIIRIQ